jgi:hypothetical protein
MKACKVDSLASNRGRNEAWWCRDSLDLKQVSEVATFLVFDMDLTLRPLQA